MRGLARALLSIVCVMSPIGGSMHAQGATPTHQGFTVTPYLWMASFHGDVGVGPLAVHADISFKDVLDNLKFAAMATGEYRRGAWVGAVDAVYVSVGEEAAIAFRADTGRYDLSNRTTIIQPMGGYSITQKRWAVDILGGLRYWKLNTTLDVDRPRRTSTTSRNLTRDWVDAAAGVAVHWLANDNVHITAGGDGGGGGSRGSWQAYGDVRLDVWKAVGIDVAYRALSVDYDRDRLLFDATLRGFVLGATVRF